MKNNTSTRLAAILSLALLAPAHAAMTITSAENYLYFHAGSASEGIVTEGTPFSFEPTMGGSWFYGIDLGGGPPFYNDGFWVLNERGRRGRVPELNPALSLSEASGDFSNELTISRI